MFSSSRKNLRVAQFNVENLFLYLDFYTGQDLRTINNKDWQKLSASTTPNKPIDKTWAIARTIDAIDADIVMLNEVGGLESLKNFANHFLGNRYVPYLKEGNSPRGIDVGYLVRAGLEYTAVHISHKNRPIHFLYPHETSTSSGGKSHYLSRDLSELRIFQPGNHSPSLICLLAHLKSKLDPDHIDPGGALRRQAELKTIVDIYNDIRHELGAKVPVILAGDLNGIARKAHCEPEFKYLYENSDLVDVFEAADLPEDNRTTQIQINSSGKSYPIQIDYIFVSPELVTKIITQETGNFRFRNELGQPSPWPTNLDDRDRLPSDHYPIVASFKWP